MKNKDVILTINNLNKSFKKNQVLKNLSCQIEKGKVYGLIGANGAGKTTLIKCIIGALNLDSGEILINNITNKNINAKANLCYVPEKNTFPNEYNVKQFLEHIAIIKGYNKTKRNILIAEILNKYNLTNIAKMNPNKLSSGLQKQLMIDGALISDPIIILMDEPTINLDPTNRFAFFDKIKDFKTRKKTVIISSHILDELANVADQFLILQNGKIENKAFINKNNNYFLIKTFNKHDLKKIIVALSDNIIKQIKETKNDNEVILELKAQLNTENINYLAYKEKITLAKCERYQDKIFDVYHVITTKKEN